MSNPVLTARVFALVAAGLLAMGCGGTMTFHGAKTISVEGTPPAPPPQKSRINVGEKKIEISEKIQFGDDSDKILEASYGLLDELTAAIKGNPQITKILIEGHASSEGNAAHNLKLSDERAHAVMDYLVKHGIDKSRLSAKGFGASRPIADNKTEEGREKNRRVDFTIVSQKKK